MAESVPPDQLHHILTKETEGPLADAANEIAAADQANGTHYLADIYKEMGNFLAEAVTLDVNEFRTSSIN